MAERESSGAFLRDLRTLPNLVSMGRVVFIYLAMGLWYFGYFVPGLWIGVLAGLTDYLDGYLARRLNQCTRIGGLLDQAADILFMTGCIFVFVRDGTWPPILLYIVLFRETMVLCLRASAAEMGFSLPSIFLGKWASNWMFYSLAIMGIVKGKLLPEPYNGWARFVSHTAMVVGVTSSVVTATIYLRKYASRYRPASDRAATHVAAPADGSASDVAQRGRDEGPEGAAADHG